MNDRPERYYYYANERGCMKHPDSVDTIGVGIEGGVQHGCLTIDLIRFEDRGSGPRFSMKVSAHCDEWRALSACRDILDLLSVKSIPSGMMSDAEPFYALRIHIENLGYKNLGVLTRER